MQSDRVVFEPADQTAGQRGKADVGAIDDVLDLGGLPAPLALPAPHVERYGKQQSDPRSDCRSQRSYRAPLIVEEAEEHRVFWWCHGRGDDGVGLVQASAFSAMTRP